MFLAHERKDKGGTWEIAWMWLPHFLATDAELHKFVGNKMTELYRGETWDSTPEALNHLLRNMHDDIIRLIMEKYPIPGLRQYLEAVIYLQPEAEAT